MTTDRLHQAIRALKATATASPFPGARASIDSESAEALLGLLPDDVVQAATAPPLPTEPGLYVDTRGVGGSVWRVEMGGTVHREGGLDEPPAWLLPLRRLVVEAESTPAPHVFTGDELRDAYRASGKVAPAYDFAAAYVNSKIGA